MGSTPVLATRIDVFRWFPAPSMTSYNTTKSCGHFSLEAWEERRVICTDVGVRAVTYVVVFRVTMW